MTSKGKQHGRLGKPRQRHAYTTKSAMDAALEHVLSSGSGSDMRIGLRGRDSSSSKEIPCHQAILRASVPCVDKAWAAAEAAGKAPVDAGAAVQVDIASATAWLWPEATSDDLAALISWVYTGKASRSLERVATRLGLALPSPLAPRVESLLARIDLPHVAVVAAASAPDADAVLAHAVILAAGVPAWQKAWEGGVAPPARLDASQVLPSISKDQLQLVISHMYAPGAACAAPDLQLGVSAYLTTLKPAVRPHVAASLADAVMHGVSQVSSACVVIDMHQDERHRTGPLWQQLAAWLRPRWTQAQTDARFLQLDEATRQHIRRSGLSIGELIDELSENERAAIEQKVRHLVLRYLQRQFRSITIPDQRSTIRAGIAGSVKTACGKIQLQVSPSTVHIDRISATLKRDVLHVDVRQIDATIPAMTWSYQQTSFPKLSDSGTAQVAVKGVAVALTFRLVDAKPLPDVLLDTCRVRMDAPPVITLKGAGSVAKALYSAILASMSDRIQAAVIARLTSLIRSSVGSLSKDIAGLGLDLVSVSRALQTK